MILGPDHLQDTCDINSSSDPTVSAQTQAHHCPPTIQHLLGWETWQLHLLEFKVCWYSVIT